MSIYQKIDAIRKEAGALAKNDGGTEGVKFKFRGIDSTINHLSSHLESAGVLVFPVDVEKEVTTRELGGGKAITQTDLAVTYRFVDIDDGSDFLVRVPGLAQDYSDRSSAQAMSVAFRIALLQTFFLPTDDKEPEVAGEETQKYIEDANKDNSRTAAKKPSGPTLAELKGAMRTQLEARGIKGIAKIREYGNNFYKTAIEADPSKKDKWIESPEAITKVLKHLESGEITEGVDDVEY